MSHVKQRAIECPLASLGHNTPTLDTLQGYHHPLSTSPLDTQAYQMLRKPQESPILSLDTDKIRVKNTDTSRSNRSNTTPTNKEYPQPQQQRHVSSTPVKSEPSAFLSHCDLQRLRNQTYTPIETILRGSYPHPPMPAPHLQRRGQSSLTLDDDVSLASIGELTDVERFFLGEKLSSIFINSRNGVYGSTSSGDSGTNRSTKERSEMKNTSDDSRFFREQDNVDEYHYYSIPNGQINEFNSPAGRRRGASSPDTSGSDKYFLDRLRGSPNFVARNQKLVGKSIIGFKNFPENYAQTDTQSYIGENLRIGRLSPLDQGYHTLNTPSPPSTQQLYLPNHWNSNTTNVLKKVSPKPGKGFNRLNNELVLRIFEWLDSCDLCNLTQVCKRFETLVWSPVLWRNIVIKGKCFAPLLFL